MAISCSTAEAANCSSFACEDGNLRKGPVFEGMRWPQFLPGGDRLIYAVYDKASQQSHAMAADYTSRQAGISDADGFAGPIRAAAASPESPDTCCLFAAGACSPSLSTPSRLRFTGEPFPIAQNVIYYGPNLSASFSVSGNGVLVYQAGFSQSRS